MPSSRARIRRAACLCGLACTTSAMAQTASEGFAVERLTPCAPGSAFLVMDDLNLQGKLGGAVSLTSGYAHNPLGVARGRNGEQLAVVSDQSFADIAMAVLFDRFRGYVGFSSPLYIRGKSGTVGRTQFTAPHLDLGSYPDKMRDVQLGFDSRLWGTASAPWRLGLSAQLFVPSGGRRLYLSDGTYRGALRGLFAGNAGPFAYAAHFGVHLRPRSEATSIEGPRGSEFLFGVAAGPVFFAGSQRANKIRVGPELPGATATRSPIVSKTTAIEALLSAQFEHLREDGSATRVKVAVGEGVYREFGAPDFRFVIGVELGSRLR